MPKEASAMSAQLRMSSASCPPAPEVLTDIVYPHGCANPVETLDSQSFRGFFRADATFNCL
jgi:hypothetical protein